jgi:hypothetical protein
VLAGMYVAAFLIPSVRRFFELSILTLGMTLTAVLASLLAIGALALAGYTPTAGDGATEGT